MNLFEDTYFSPAQTGESIFRDRGSKFLGFVYPVSSEEEAKKMLSLLRKEHPGANHHCYAMRLGAGKQFFRVNDDGEPAGTAGRPIYGQIQSQDLTDVLVVVVRYFGGTLLGVSGLINAYKQAAAESLAAAERVERTVNEHYELQFPYEAMNDVMRLLKEYTAGQSKQDFGLACSLEIGIRKRDAGSLMERLQKLPSLKARYLHDR
jgi:uncharacterized YigZ family protein